MKSSPTRPSLPLAILLATAAICPLVSGQTIPDIAPEIVSAWKANGGDALLIFRYDGVYFQVQDDASRPGMERGTFTWNKVTEAFSATTLRDTNGENGLSHPLGATTLSVIGDTLTYNVVGEGSFTFSRVANNTASAIVGSWFIPGDPTTVTFLAGSISGNLSTGTYYATEEEDDAPFAYDGMERGTYTWNSSSKVLTAIPITDTNGDTGLTGLPPGFTATIVGNAMTVPDDDEETPTVLETKILRRLTQIPTLLDVQNDFEVDQFSNYRQTSAASPTLLPVPVPVNEDFPFWGEAYIEDTISGTGGTLTITDQAARPFINNDGWGIETEYTTLPLLNASSAFPNNADYVFARTGGTATLSFPAGGTFPIAPKIVGDIENGSWSGGEYLLGQDPTLIWNAHTDYNPATLVTVLSVVDQETGDELLYETVIQGDITSYDFGGKLTPGHSYDVQLEHIKIASSTTAGTGPFAGKLGYALYNSNTRFTMVAPEEPNAEPFITQQPVSQLPAAAAKVILTVGTNGEDHTLTYQWFKDGNPIPGQTGNSLSICNYSNAVNGGTYNVVVSNAAGSDTSNLAALGPAIVKFVIVGKEIEYVQTGVSTVVVNPELPSEFYGGAYGFNASVEGQNMQLLTAPTVTPPAGTPNTAGDPFYSTLYLDEWDEPEWSYGPNANNWGDTSQSAIDTRFPNGTYTFSVGGVSVPLNLTGNAYPNTPQLTLTGGTWINGKYAMDAANPLTVTTNVFTGYGSNVDGHIGLWINDVGVEYFKNSSPATSSANYTLLANTLPTDQVTYIDAGFDAIVNKSAALSGAYCAAVYSKSVDMEVHILPKIISQTSSRAFNLGDIIDFQVTATGSPATVSGSLNYQWKKNGIDIGLPFSSFGMQAVFASEAGTYTCTVSNDVGTVTSLPIYLEFADSFQSYAASFGLNSLTTGAPDADFDKDGIPTLLEYLLGGNPTLPSSGLLPTLTKAPGSSNVVFTYKRKIAATGVTQVIEHSENLSNTWESAEHGIDGVTIITVAVPGDATAEQVTATIPSTSTSRFVRLEALR